MTAVLGVVGAVIDLARPWPLALAVDYAIGGRELYGISPGTLLTAAGVVVVLLSAVSGLVNMAAVVLSERAAERVGARLRKDLFDRSVSLSLRWHDRMRSGELVSRITTDVLLDEPTTSLDPEASATVVNAIRRSTAGRTVLLVTHDRYLAKLADRVVVIDRHGASVSAWQRHRSSVERR